jgi:hypothetical protein
VRFWRPLREFRRVPLGFVIALRAPRIDHISSRKRPVFGEWARLSQNSLPITLELTASIPIELRAFRPKLSGCLRVVEVTDLSSWGVALAPRQYLNLGHREDRTMTAKTKTAKQTPSNKSPKIAPAAKGKAAKKAASSKTGPATKLSAIAAAARVLSETGRAVTCPELIEAMAAKRYWKSPGGKTPASTLYASIYQEIKSKRKDSRFRKTERGKFAATGVA